MLSSNPRRSTACLFLVVAGMCFSLEAQATGDAEGPASQGGAKEAKPTRLGRIAVTEVSPLCFETEQPTEKSPRFPDVLRQGQAVRTRPAEYGCVEVVLPLGVQGYVSKKFTTEPDERGIVTATGSRVSFRYRKPRGAEAPVTMVPKGTEFYFVAEDGDWWIVRSEDCPAYLRATDVSYPDAAGMEALEASWQELNAAHQKVWREASTSRREAQVTAAAEARHRKQLQDLQGRFAELRAQPVETRDFSGLRVAVGSLKVQLEEDSKLGPAIEEMLRDIQQAELVVQATKLAKEPIPRKETPVEDVPKPVPDALGDFDAVGWLRHDKPLAGVERFVLEKGKKLVFVLTCTTGRYDLSMFDGVEVGVRGTRHSALDGEVRELDVQRLEILSLQR